MALPGAYITPEEYLDLDRAATDAKHEYFAGDVRPYERKTVDQCRIASHLLMRLADQIGSSVFYVLGSSLRIGTDQFFAYPSVSVCRSTPRLRDAHKDVLLDPIVLAGVTLSANASRRFEHYRTIPALQDYLVVAQDRMHVEHHQRQAEGKWLLTDYRAPDDTFALTGVPATLTLSDLYHRISFDT